MFSNGHLSVSESRLEDNQAGKLGGAICSQSPTEISECNFLNNASVSGGAIYSRAQTSISRSEFAENTANDGGAIDHDFASLFITEAKFEGNVATKQDGAILLRKNGKAEISETKFTSNDSGSEGGAIYDVLNSYTDPADATQGYTNLITDETVSFENNSAAYLYNPPSNYKDFSWIRFARTTFTGALNPFNKKPILKYDFPLNNYDINYMNNPTDFFPITFEYKSRDAKEALPDVIAQLCPEEIKSTLNALIIPPLPEQEEIEVEGKLWKFDTWDPAQNEVKEEGIHFTGYWYPAKDISVTKLWDDANNQDGKRADSINIRLWKNGQEISSRKVTSTQGWKWIFQDLPKYESGQEIRYTLRPETGRQRFYGPDYFSCLPVLS